MRTLLCLVCVGCSSKSAPPADDHPASGAPVVADAAAVAASPIDAAGASGPTRAPATEIRPVELVGPAASLQASCASAAPCGFLDMDDSGNEINPAKTPDCDAVIDPSSDIVGNVPDSIKKSGGATKLTHVVGATEIRVGGVRCAVPKGLRGEGGQYYVFVKRADGWWRTKTAMFEYSYNDKYCGGGLYISWNDKPTRTIAGIAASASCLACTKQAQHDSVIELMLRVETTGDKPAVWPFLPVGTRDKLELFSGAGDISDPDCKAHKSADSLKEAWPADDEVVLTGKPLGSAKSTEGLTINALAADGSISPGRYRFVR